MLIKTEENQLRSTIRESKVHQEIGSLLRKCVEEKRKCLVLSEASQPKKWNHIGLFLEIRLT